MADDLNVKKKLAYYWEMRERHIERIWIDAINPPSSLRAVANKVAASKAAKFTAKALQSMKRRGIIKP